ncbi:MAG: phage/plasmid primase, P4 family [Blastocatellia bacterium]
MNNTISVRDSHPFVNDPLDGLNFDQRLTDAANARRFAERYKDRLMYVPQRGGWLVWNGRFWQPDTGPTVRELAIEAAVAIAEEAHTEPDVNRKQEVLEHSTGSLASGRLCAMTTIAADLMTVSASALDTGHELLNVANGTIDLRTGKLRPHDPADRITRMIPVEHHPGVRAARWEQFLREIFQDDEELIAFVQRAIGLSITGRRERVLFVAEGVGANGKSVLLDTICEIIGDYAARISANVILSGKYQADGNSASPELAKLAGKRMVVASETDEGRQLNCALVKTITGDSHRVARHLYQSSFEYEATDTIWLATNHLPVIGDAETAVLDRIRRVPFRRRFSEAEQDKYLLDKLRAERAGILAWLVAGAAACVRDGLGTCAAVEQAGTEYAMENDSVLAFLDERCRVEPGNRELRAAPSALHQEYQRFCAEAGRSAVSQKQFARQLQEVHKLSQGKSGGGRYWLGISVRVEPDTSLPEDVRAEPDQPEATGESLLSGRLILSQT